MKIIYVTKDDTEYNAFDTVIKQLKLPVVIERYTSSNRLFDYLFTLGPDEQLPDAVFIDANPKTDWEKGILNEIKTVPMLVGINVFIYSEIDSEPERRCCYDLKGDGFFVKAKNDDERKAIVKEIYQSRLKAMENIGSYPVVKTKLPKTEL